MKAPYISIQGGSVLKGTVSASGAKNAALPILFSTLLADGEYQFQNIPVLDDVKNTLKILQSIGCSFHRDQGILTVQSSYLKNSYPSQEMVQKLRASFLCLGPLLTRHGEAKIPLPGGCQIGSRPIDLHLKGLKSLGAKILHEENFVHAVAPQGLKGNLIVLDFPTVGGTQNLIMASVLAEGQTVIKNRACEPEISDLISCLKQMGAQIEETEDRELTITGVPKLHPVQQYKIIPDRIEVGTFLLAGAITGGEVKVTNCRPEHLDSFIQALKECGFIVEAQDQTLLLKSTKIKKPLHIKTGVYPKFPTDLQSPFLALMTQLEGESSLTENIFENRFRYVDELKKLKAIAKIEQGKTVCVNGPAHLKGASVQATDLRASSGLILAGLIAEGKTNMTDIFHLDRGYENFIGKLRALGAIIERYG